jgi:hypothetical protein
MHTYIIVAKVNILPFLCTFSFTKNVNYWEELPFQLGIGKILFYFNLGLGGITILNSGTLFYQAGVIYSIGVLHQHVRHGTRLI